MHAAVPLERGAGGVGAVDRRRLRRSGWPGGSRRRAGCPRSATTASTYFNYTGKPLAYLLAQPERADDAENPLRVAFGNEGSPQVVAEFARRFGVEVIDAYGATEGGVAVEPRRRAARRRAGLAGRGREDRRRRRQREAGGRVRRRRPPAERGRVCGRDRQHRRASVRSRATTTTPRPTSRRRASAGTGRATSGTWTPTIISTSPAATPTGSASTARTSRPVRSRRPCATHPDVVLAAVYGVPDDQAGDQAMAGLVLREGATFDPAGFAAWIDAQTDIGPKWRPRYVRVMAEPPTTGHVQDREAHAGAREVALRPRGTATRCSSGAATSPRTGRSPRPTRTRCTRRSSRTGATGSGTCERSARRYGDPRWT